ncbi:TMV resistance protein N [Quillaja saponaria]|uniref:TMV resistance protein N n=1 Tax=Quillaja saponaria TaxID=32244 RepID=A0AAD7PNJ8_QUISA|nr:TMV resistance protein N [Quillaja saponaria]
MAKENLGLAMASSSATSSSTQKHEVYISLKNDDPQIKFIADMMSTSLTIRGVPTFKDEKQLRKIQKGTNLKRELKEAIGMSKICVVLFSKDYVYTSWCLEELVVILRCRQRWGLIVLPIFYDMDPSDIRKQRGDAFKLVNAQIQGRVWWRRWKSALKEAGNLSGWDHRGSSRIESLLVGKLVEDIVEKRIPTNLNISIYPLRYDTCDQYLNLFLQVGKDDVLMVGICGESKMGKTAIAKAVYEQTFYTFESSSFLSNVSQNSRQSNGLVYLQEKLLSDILLERNINILNVTRGMDMIKDKLSFKKVLIVLDDVDDLEQLYALVGSRSWFGLGSKIIITTRNLQLLNAFGIDQIFLAQGLPLPPNIQAILGHFQQSRRIIGELQEYIQVLHQLTTEKEMYLKGRLLIQRQKKPIQGQKQAHDGDSSFD